MAGSFAMSISFAYLGTMQQQDTLALLAMAAFPISLILSLVLGWLAWYYGWGGTGYAVYLYGRSLFLPKKITIEPPSYEIANTIAQALEEAVLVYRANPIDAQTEWARIDRSGWKAEQDEPLIAGNSLQIQQDSVVSAKQITDLTSIKSLRVANVGGFSAWLGWNPRFWEESFQRWLNVIAIWLATGLALFGLVLGTFILSSITDSLSPALTNSVFAFFLGLIFSAGVLATFSYYLYSMLMRLNIWQIIATNGTVSLVIYKSEDRDQTRKYAEIIMSAIAGRHSER
jgi:MFS family permease